jgi:hypothetical protein
MSAAFDPYYKWLGIPPQDQPADHYRLLGLTHFESDPQVIESAADRQMVHLRTFATGQHSALSQKLLNEVAAARICLLNPAKKAAYDESLRSQMAAQPVAGVPYAAVAVSTQPASAQAIPVQTLSAQGVEVPMVEVPIVAVGRRTITRGRGRKRSIWQHPAMISAGLTLVILVAAIALVVRNGGNPEPQSKLQPDTPAPAKTASIVPAQEKSPRHSTGGSAGQTLNTATDTNSPAKGASGVADSGRASPPDNKLLANTSNAGASRFSEIPSSANMSPSRPGRRLDLLKMVDLLRHRVEGDWQRTGSELTVSADKKARLRLPYRPDGRSYELRLEARRDSGNHALKVGLVHRGREFLVLIDREEVTLLSHVDGQRQASDAQWQRSVFQPGQFADIIISVRDDRLSILANDRPLVTWTDYDRLSPNPDWNERQGLLMLGADGSAFTISKIMLTSSTQAASASVATITKPPQAPTVDPSDSPGAFAGVSPPATGQKPLPSAADRAKAEASFKQTFADKLKQATKPADKATLARELALTARTASANPPDHYVLLTEARQLAADAGEAALAIELVAEFERHFQNDYWPSRIETLKAASAATPEARQAVMAMSLELAEQAAKQDQYEPAVDLCAVAATAAAMLKDTDQNKAARERQAEYRSRQKQWETASQARDKLEKAPDDPAANLLWGKYLCLVRGDWSTGLKHLAKGSDSRLREAATQELSSDNSAEARAETGDNWFAVAEGAKADKAAFLSRAKQWYEQAAPQLALSERTRIEKRIGEISDQVHRLTGGKNRASFPLTGLVGRVLVGGKDANLVIHYQPTKGFNSEAFKELLAKHNIKGNGIRVELAGVMRLPVDTYAHFFAGGNSGAMLNQLSIDGAGKHSIDASGKQGKYGMTSQLRAGDYYIRWVLAGNTIEDCSMGIEATMQNFQPLPIGHTPDMLSKLRPQRAKDEVDVSRN